MQINTGNIFVNFLANLSILGIMDLCFVFCNGLSNTKINAGNTVMQPITPRITPLAITIPKSLPRVKLMKQRAIKPATVVIDDPTTDAIVSFIA